MFRLLRFVIGFCIMWFGVGLLGVDIWPGVTLIAIGILGMAL